MTLFFVIYFIFQLKTYFFSTRCSYFISNKNKFSVEKNVRITGKTEKDTSVTISGERIYQNKKGVFTYEYSLNEGENKLIINLVGANGKKAIVEKTFFKKTP